MLRLTEAGVPPVHSPTFLLKLNQETAGYAVRRSPSYIHNFSLPSFLFSGERLHRQGYFKILLRTGSRKKSWGNNGDSSTYVRRL